MDKLSPWCFNPYSIGSYSGRKGEWFFYSDEIVFQSLFYWKLLWKIAEYFYEYVHEKVSILILLEVTLEEKYKLTEKEVHSLFQSLFYWKLLWKA